MATLWSSSPSPAAAAPASAMEENAGNNWAPHGTVLTACVVSINLLVIALIFFFFWRFFSGKQDPSTSSAAGAEDDDELPVASPWAYHRRRNAPRRPPPRDDLVKSLPVYVYSIAEAGGKAAECAVCIVELKDGDAAPSRHVSTLPRQRRRPRRANEPKGRRRRRGLSCVRPPRRAKYAKPEEHVTMEVTTNFRVASHRKRGQKKTSLSASIGILVLKLSLP